MKPAAEQDLVNQKILELLSENARLPLSSIARAVHLSRTAVQARIEKLEQEGAIRGYTIVQAERTEVPLGAVVSVKVGAQNRRAALNYIHASDIVSACYSMTGNSDFEIFLKKCHSDRISQFCKRLWEHPGVVEVETKIVLNTEFVR